MDVLFVASEAVPFAKTGGLADVVGSLPKALREQGVDARVVIPEYGSIPEEYRSRMKQRAETTVPLAWRNQYCGLEELDHEGVPFYFIDNEFYFGRSNGLYGYFDEAERFAFFARAVLETLPYMGFQPHVIHCHDWHTGLVSVYLKSHYSTNPFYQNIRTVFTIHSLAYQGVFDRSILHDVLGLGDEYFTIDGLEFYGSVSFMKGALNFSDIITTVSETYAAEIQTSYFGCGLDGLLLKRRGDLFGVVNGIDYREYDPATDPHIFANYSDSLDGKRRNKTALQVWLGLPVREEVPLIGMVSRLVGQKGLDLVECVLEELLSRDIQVVVLGTGDRRYEDMFTSAAGRHSERLSANIGFDNTLAHRIYAASDMFLMPSLFEPCGLSQLIALRYGSVPIVRETGGLNDTVQSYNEFTGEGNGFSFACYNAHDMLHTIERALKFYSDQDVWERIVKNAMASDNSWSKPARKYGDLYGMLHRRFC